MIIFIQIMICSFIKDYNYNLTLFKLISNFFQTKKN